MSLSPVGKRTEELWVRLSNLWVLGSGAPTSPRVLGSCDPAVISLLPSARKGDAGSACWGRWGLGALLGRERLGALPVELPVVTQAYL